jgi:hypothetical protein
MDKPIKRFTKKELHDLLYCEARHVDINLTYEGDHEDAEVDASKIDAL